MIELSKTLKYWFFAVLAAVTVVGVLVIRKLMLKPTPTVGLPDIPPKLKEMVEKTKEEVLVAKTEAKVKAEYQKEELSEILKIDDGKTRRDQLASLLEKLSKP